MKITCVYINEQQNIHSYILRCSPHPIKFPTKVWTFDCAFLSFLLCPECRRGSIFSSMYFPLTIQWTLTLNSSLHIKLLKKQRLSSIVTRTLVMWLLGHVIHSVMYKMAPPTSFRITPTHWHPLSFVYTPTMTDTSQLIIPCVCSLLYKTVSD